ncbi:MAG TPA: hypothetical protein VNC39_03015 [Acidocella sp.]|uniref:hypothetical protein n=1 Tax=Acidocella sp. TaxID=50710 RepID=UPI002CA0D440|nr:hypothetical protein [Acidocella sp.]HVE20919.1 hypothetical protein [Acidocella sp.]
MAVEFALLSTFFLLPLFGGSADMVEYISAKAQLNTALQALYYYALTTPPAAATSGDPEGVVALMSSAPHPLTLNSYSLSYSCISNAATTVTYTATTAATGCPTGNTERITAAYSVSTTVHFVVPVPFASTNPLTLTDTGVVQIQ